MSVTPALLQVCISKRLFYFSCIRSLVASFRPDSVDMPLQSRSHSVSVRSHPIDSSVHCDRVVIVHHPQRIRPTLARLDKPSLLSRYLFGYLFGMFLHLALPGFCFCVPYIFLVGITRTRVLVLFSHLYASVRNAADRSVQP